MDWGNAVIKTVIKDDSGDVKHIDAELHLAGDFKSTEKKLTWLSNFASTPNPGLLVKTTLLVGLGSVSYTAYKVNLISENRKRIIGNVKKLQLISIIVYV